MVFSLICFSDISPVLLRVLEGRGGTKCRGKDTITRVLLSMTKIQQLELKHKKMNYFIDL